MHMAGRKNNTWRCLMTLALTTALTACHSAWPPASQTATNPAESTAFIRFQNSESFCSAALIAPRLLLTARHCVQLPGTNQPMAPDQLTVGFGDNALQHEDHGIAVQAIRLPPQTEFSRAEDLMGTDLAVLQLNRAAPIPVMAVAQFQQDEIPEQLTLIGYGVTRAGYYGLRHETQVKVHAHNKATLTFSGGGCKGDSGGPLVNDKGELLAIVSLGTSRLCTVQQQRFGQRINAVASMDKVD
jgi:secreted trypsin-like serine protease